jgi:hypothetical protein
MYKIIGGDGRQYGPVTPEQLREWIASGRANGQTMIQREGDADWKPLSAFTEFADALTAAPPPQTQPPPAGPPPSSGTADPAALANEVLARGGRVDIGSCLGRAWDLLKSDFWPIVGVGALLLLCFGAANSIYVGLVLNGPLLGGFFWYCLKRVRRQPAQLNDAFAGFTLAFLQLFLGALVSSLLIGVGMIIDRRMEFWPAMELSRRVLTKHWWNVFLFMLVCGLINFGGALLCGLGLFITWPLTFLATTLLYEDLFGNSAPGAA